MTSWPHCVFLTLTPPVLPVSLCRAEAWLPAPSQFLITLGHALHQMAFCLWAASYPGHQLACAYTQLSSLQMPRGPSARDGKGRCHGPSCPGLHVHSDVQKPPGQPLTRSFCPEQGPSLLPTPHSWLPFLPSQGDYPSWVPSPIPPRLPPGSHRASVPSRSDPRV